MRKVGVVKTAQTPYVERALDNVLHMNYETTKNLLDDAGISIDDIDVVIEGSSDYWRGVACSNVATAESTAGYLKEMSKVEQDGAFAFLYAYMRILSGQFETALVVSDTKCSEVNMPSSNLTSVSADPIYQRWIGVDELSTAAIQAQAYMDSYGVEEKQVSEVSVKNFNNAKNNPYAHRKLSVNVDDVIESEMISYPLRELHCPPYSDGACAIILASEEKAEEITDNPAWVKGVGWSTHPYFLSDRDLTDLSHLQSAAKNAYKMAQIDNPLNEIDVAEISEPYASQELLWYEGLGFCGRGGAPDLLDDGVTEMGGSMPVNPSGGVISSNPYVARGLIRIIEASLQIRGEAGKRQVPDAETSLAHAIGGFAGQTQAVICLSS